ncbi:MAG: hypothetical protein NWQ23_15250 [Yoonia sp.]|uniref:hypothetical protein n=1 Tax=Yoonia sp. TaxID=2212373 RepID=UPI00273E951D|nr:hypothetical protein [Yoonia sp.]MDP5086773.1 hypothetical protein [Yoonia sp.]
MIFPLSGLVLGAIIGAFRARSRGGKGKDMLQWGAVFAIIFGLIGLFVLIFLQRSLV